VSPDHKCPWQESWCLQNNMCPWCATQACAHRRRSSPTRRTAPKPFAARTIAAPRLELKKQRFAQALPPLHVLEAVWVNATSCVHRDMILLFEPRAAPVATTVASQPKTARVAQETRWIARGCSVSNLLDKWS